MGTLGGPQLAAKKLGSYEILSKLARGGMAELFLARTVGPEGSEKLVALKKILPEYATNAEFVTLFLDEAKLVSALDHPHIAHVYDMGMVDGHYFFAMEYVHGKDVHSTLRRTAQRNQPFPIAPAIQIAREVASALHYAHDRTRPDGTLLGIVHRDVSPSNLLISYDGAVKLVDFGIAKAASSSVTTRTGTVKGKIAYMSPEQAKGLPLDRRSDVFSLGIVLWEMITGQRLFRANNDFAALQMIVNARPPPPSQLRPDCPPELDQIVLKALAMDVDARYQTAQALDDALQELALETWIGSAPISLRAYMQRMFEPEIAAWREAQDGGMTFMDHVIATSSELLTPVSDHEIELEEADDESRTRTNLDARAGLVDASETTSDTDDTIGRGTRAAPEAPPLEDAARPTRPLAVTGPAEGFEPPTSLYAPGGTPRPRLLTPVPGALDLTSIPQPIQHMTSGPIIVAVTSYPSLRSDPSYELIQRERKPEPRPAPLPEPPRSRARFTIAVAAGAVIAVAIGVVAALALSHRGATPSAGAAPAAPPIDAAAGGTDAPTPAR